MKTVEPITKENIEHLEALGQKSHEAIEGYKVAEGLVLTEEMRTRFANYRVERQKMLSELNDMYKVGNLDEKTDTGILSELHRSWMKIKSNVATGQREAVIEECIRGEEMALKAYSKALETDWGPEQRETLSSHMHTIRQHKDYLDSLS